MLSGISHGGRAGRYFLGSIFQGDSAQTTKGIVIPQKTRSNIDFLISPRSDESNSFLLFVRSASNVPWKLPSTSAVLFHHKWFRILLSGCPSFALHSTICRVFLDGTRCYLLILKNSVVLGARQAFQDENPSVLLLEPKKKRNILWKEWILISVSISIH